MNRTAIVAAMFCLVLCACSKAPSDGKIEQQVVATLTAGGADKLYDVENFRKTNGLQKDDKTYEAQIHYEIVFKKAIDEFMRKMDANPMQPAGGLGAAYMVIGKALAQGARIAPGQRVPVDESVTLLKTDNGWQVAGQ